MVENEAKKNIKMKFIVSSSVLLKQLQQISGVISNNTVLPILEDFLFELEGKNLHIVATDLETVMRVHLEIESNDAGRICIPSKILLDTLKNLPDQPVTFNIDPSNAIEITTESGKYKIMGESAESFPKEPSKENATPFSIPENALLTGINKTLFAASTDDFRPAMTGVFVEITSDYTHFVTTDAHRLVKYKRTDVKLNESASFILPKKPLNILKNILNDSDELLEAAFNEKHFFVSSKTIQLSCRLIDARFPDYRVVIPTDNPYTLTLHRQMFQSALKRVNVFANKSTNQVAFTIGVNELQLAAQDIDFSFEGNERLACQYDGEQLQIAFNAKFLSEMLNVLDTDEVKMELSASNKAGLLKPMENGDHEELVMLIMPLMLNNS